MSICTSNFLDLYSEEAWLGGAAQLTTELNGIQEFYHTVAFHYKSKYVLYLVGYNIVTIFSVCLFYGRLHITKNLLTSK